MIVKTHPGHPELSTATADIVIDAIRDIAPAGAFATVAADEDGVTVLTDRRIKAGAFTGST